MFLKNAWYVAAWDHSELNRATYNQNHIWYAKLN